MVFSIIRAARLAAVCAAAFAAVSALAQESINDVMERGRNLFADGAADQSDAAKRNPKGAEAQTANQAQQQVEALVKSGVDNYENKAFSEAVAFFTEAIRLKPSAAHLYNLRGIAYDELGDYDKAITNYDEAIGLDPQSAIYPNNRDISVRKRAARQAAEEEQRATAAAAEAARIAAEQQAAEAARIAAEQQAAAVAPTANESGLSYEYKSAGRRSSGIVYFYRNGRKIEPSTLRVFDAQGRLLKRISINDRGRDSRGDARAVGSWDMTDMNSRQVRNGAYKVTGTIATRDGKSEEVSLILDIQ